MREIKFRAWDTVNEMWLKITGFETHISDDDKTASINTGIAGMFHDGDYIGTFQKHGEEQNNVILVQYTGLKDKNGREIYEGDILRVWQEDEYIPNRDSGGGIIDYDCETGFSQIGKVGFEGCSFDYNTIKTLNGRHEKIHIPVDWINNYEVIGNIYENPELLEVKENE